MIKKCELCGDEFKAKRKDSKFCYKNHMRNCIVCEDSFKVATPNKPAITCSQSCVGKYSKNPSSYINVYEDNRHKYLKKCGICGDEFETNNKMKKYCDKTHIRFCELCAEDFETETVGQIYCKKQHYKECEICKTQFKVKQNHRPGKVCSFKCGARLTNLRLNRDPKNYQDWESFKEFVIKTNYDCYELSEHFNMPIGSIKNKAHTSNATGFIKDFYSYSNPELETKHMLISLGFQEGEDFLPNVRSVISPFELDFYLPNYSLAIEVSPTHTHNSKYGWAKMTKGLNKDYHYNKFKMCEDKGIDLITIFDWMSLSDIKKIIKTKCNLYKENFENSVFIKMTKNKIIISNEEQKEIAIATFKVNETNGVCELISINFKYDYCTFTITSLILRSIINNYKEKINKIEVKIDLSNGIGIIYKKLGFKRKCLKNPKLHYHHSTKNIYVPSSEISEKEVDYFDSRELLPIYDCGHEILTFQC